MSVGSETFDVAVIGGGIGGATAACHIASAARGGAAPSVVLLEQEQELAHHTTSRSAAIFLEFDGVDAIQELSRASRAFLEANHPELDAPLLDPLPVVDIGNESTRADLAARVEQAREETDTVRLIETDELLDMCPVLNPEVVTVGMVEGRAASLDVMALHQLYVRRAVAHGAEVRRSARVSSIAAGTNGGFTLTTPAGTITAGRIVNAAGAWGDGVAKMAGVAPVGLEPKRRTAFTTSIAQDPSGWPFIYSAIDGLHGYFKPEAGNQLLCSLADETPSAPVDAKPEEIDVAQAIENINTMTTLNIRSVNTTWAGLRTFAPDRGPVFGPDDQNENFIWMVGQGGWGIVSSPAAGMIAAAAATNAPFPSALADRGLVAADLQPRR